MIVKHKKSYLAFKDYNLDFYLFSKSVNCD